MGDGPEQEGLRVVDRRRFTSTGEVREGEERPDSPGPERTAAPGAAASQNSSSGPSKPADEGAAQPKAPERTADRPGGKVTAAPESREGLVHPGGDEGPGEIDFISFVVGFATQALVMLGEMPHPETGEQMIHIEGAKQMIDILAMLHRKTKGNLTAEEARVMDEVLYNLRLSFASKTTKR